ncbi:MAG: glycosyltransferase [Mycetocola sp.]
MIPLSIALVCLHTSPGTEPGTGDAGGMNVVVREQAVALGALGHRVEILTRRSDPDQPDVVELAPRVTLRALTAGPARPLPKGEHEQWMSAFEDALRTQGPWDVIHSHHWFSGIAALPIARERGIPHLQSFHSIAAGRDTPLSQGERAESPGRLAGEEYLALNSDGVITVSRAEALTTEQRLGGDPARIAIVRPGVDAECFSPAPAGAASSTEFVVAARLHPLKGIGLAVEAVAGVPSSLNARLVIAGEGSAEVPNYRAELESEATRLGIGDRLRFVGALTRAELAELFRTSRGVLVPSHSETFGLVATEASASGVPVVASAAGGLIEAVADGETGRVLDSRDPEVWSGVLTELLSDRALSHRYGAEGRARAEARGWDVSAAELAEVYAAFLAQRPLPHSLVESSQCQN